jgi:GntR family transcriptional regulator
MVIRMACQVLLSDQNNSIPLHHKLRETLRQQIVTCQLPAHERLPSERELCDQYDISRTTVRRALADLLNEGLIYTTIGKGTYVAPPQMKEELQPLSSFSEDITRRGMQPSSRLLRAEIQNANDEQAARLCLPRGAEVVSIYRLRLADGKPIALQLTWLPHHLCPDLLSFDLAQQSLYQILRGEYHFKLAHADTTIMAALGNPEECRLLVLSPPAAVLISQQATYLENDSLIEYTHSVFRSDRYKLYSSSGEPTIGVKK